jgi:drug/metabolite transporter (DMT)-like permease
MTNVVLAILFALISTTLLNLGLGLQKKGASDLPTIDFKAIKNTIKNFLKCKIWILGVLLTAVAAFINFQALEYGGLAIVTPILGFGLVILAIFSVIVLKEKIHLIELIGIALIIIGIVLVGFVATETPTPTIKVPAELIFLFVTLGILISVGIFSRVKYFQRFKVVFFGILAGITGGLGTIFGKFLVLGVTFDLADPLSWLALFTSFYLYFAIGSMAASFVFNNMAFQEGKAIISVSLYNSFMIFYPILAGAIILSEILVPLQIVGIVIIIGGGVALTRFSGSSAPEPIENASSN